MLKKIYSKVFILYLLQNSENPLVIALPDIRYSSPLIVDAVKSFPFGFIDKQNPMHPNCSIYCIYDDK